MTHVVVPAALPALLVALRLGVATSWTAVVAAELIGAPSGVGYAVEWYRELLMTPQVMAFIAMIGLLGYLTDTLIRALTRRFTPWAADPERGRDARDRVPMIARCRKRLAARRASLPLVR